MGASNSFSPQVTKTGTGPTGYTVTFRYRDATATRVQIKGEWYFSDPAQTTSTSSQGLLPEQWRPGVVPIAYPNALAANWPVRDLVQNPTTKVWSTTVPLPSGVFTYNFFVNCADPAGTGCTPVSDPANPPWNSINGQSTGSVEPTSQVYVPSDPAFGSVNYSYQAPATRHGNLVDVSYTSPTSTAPVGTHPLAVYTPPGYDRFRATAYPTLYLSHGGGGQEVDWSTQGVAGNILDNLINAKQVQPMVVVMTNFNGIPNGAEGYAQDVIQNVIPYVERYYNVSGDAADRSFAGLSLGGRNGNNLLFNHTAEFGSYGIMSNAGGYPTTLTADQIAALQQVDGIQLSVGAQDPIGGLTTTERNLLTAAGIPHTDITIAGGHEWYVWRIFLRDFLVDQALKGTDVAVTTASTAGKVTSATATVTAASTTAAAPKGSVRFAVDGAVVRTVALRNGVAASAIPRALPAGPHQLTVTYLGDNLHASSSTTVTINAPVAVSP